jgi:hypothetical protein
VTGISVVSGEVAGNVVDTQAPRGNYQSAREARPLLIR